MTPKATFCNMALLYITKFQTTINCKVILLIEVCHPSPLPHATSREDSSGDQHTFHISSDVNIVMRMSLFNQ